VESSLTVMIQVLYEMLRLIIRLSL
jgi:hypothetical protein